MLIKFEITVDDQTDTDDAIKRRLMGLAMAFDNGSSAVVPAPKAAQESNVVPINKVAKTKQAKAEPEQAKADVTPEPEPAKAEVKAEPKREVKENRDNGLIPERTTDIPPIEEKAPQEPVEASDIPENVDSFRQALSTDFTTLYRQVDDAKKIVLFSELKRYDASNIKSMDAKYLKSFRAFVDDFKANL